MVATWAGSLLQPQHDKGIFPYDSCIIVSLADPEKVRYRAIMFGRRFGSESFFSECCQGGVWLAADVADRLAASRVVAGPPSRAARFELEVRSGASEVAGFLAKLAATQGPAMEDDRKNLAKALVALSEVPSALEGLTERASSKGARWRHLTQPYYVTWCVHPLTQQEPWWNLCLSNDRTVEDVKATLYNSLAVKLVIAEVEAVVGELEPAARKRCLEATCIHYNSRSNALSTPGRLLLTTTTPAKLQFDFDPTDAKRAYAGRKLTTRQKEQNVAQARKKRVWESWSDLPA